MPRTSDHVQEQMIVPGASDHFDQEQEQVIMSKSKRSCLRTSDHVQEQAIMPRARDHGPE